MSSREYTIISTIHQNRFNTRTQEVDSGYAIRFRDAATTTVDEIFIPDDRYTPDNVRNAIMANIAVHREVHSLGT